MQKLNAMQKLKLIALPLFFLAQAAHAQRNPLVDAQWLKNRLPAGKLVVFHISQEENYKNEHIPGAVFISPSEYTVDDDPRVFDLPEETALKSLLESNGVGNDTDVVIYTGENWIPLVTRLYFTLDYLGHAGKTYILDGGLAAWKAAGGAVSQEIPKPAKAVFQPKPNPELLVSGDQVKASIDKAGTSIVDCRAPVFYQGIEPTHGARKGRVPGAKNIPYNTLYDNAGSGAYKFKSAEQLAEIFEGQGLSKDKELVLYCHIGMQLTVVYTAARMLGYENVKIYDGSFHEWGPDESLPIELD